MNTDRNNPSTLEDNELEQLHHWLAGALLPLTPPQAAQAALKNRLMDRVAQSTAKHAGLLTVRRGQGIWQPLKKGIRFKPLWDGPQGSSVLIELAAGAVLPPHRHRWLEEGIVLHGGLQMGGLDLGPLDYHLSPPGSRHASIRSRQGALAFLRGTSLGDKGGVLREMLGGLNPLGKAAHQTVYPAKSQNWIQIADGVEVLELWTDRFTTSRFCRLQAGATVPGHEHPLDEECIMLEGELFIGDILLQPADFQLAPAGTWHGEAYTDVGATLFVRGAKLAYHQGG